MTPTTTSPPILAAEVKKMVHEAGPNAEVVVEAYLEKEIGSLSHEKKVEALDRLIAQFQGDRGAVTKARDLDTSLVAKLFSMLLGERVGEVDIASEEVIERLATSLNTVFDSLNELISGINATLMGRVSGTETIRFVIGSQLDQQDEAKSLEGYVDQIKEAFAIAHQAFKDAAMTKMGEILGELDPKKIEESAEGGLKFGPLRKAELFDIFQDKHRTLRNWLETGLLTEALMREFERICQRLYQEKGGKK
ncbi:MAG TPA: hypothetical protein ENH70_00680 [Desulfobacteraceae bacterium]|nr:MAG: hypothetical protein B1H13_06480 [Desulfobacteraceae bacterium 4484_190.3]RLB17126.1 MAG: hypothetical protein DRG82_07380 [Deltaproteobacteria bacterium]HDZ23036.1 hypothetical protein [Desulfobacteraceae bacterium]